MSLAMKTRWTCRPKRTCSSVATKHCRPSRGLTRPTMEISLPHLVTVRPIAWMKRSNRGSRGQPRALSRRRSESQRIDRVPSMRGSGLRISMVIRAGRGAGQATWAKTGTGTRAAPAASVRPSARKRRRGREQQGQAEGNRMEQGIWDGFSPAPRRIRICFCPVLREEQGCQGGGFSAQTPRIRAISSGSRPATSRNHATRRSRASMRACADGGLMETVKNAW